MAASLAQQEGILPYLGDKVLLTEDLDTLKTRFREASPFPHLVLDNLFPDSLLRQLLSEINFVGSWIKHDQEELQQDTMKSVVELGEAGSQLTSILHSAPFLYLLSEISGIWNLLPDPYLQGAGYHVIKQGGHFAVHLDRNVAYDLGLFRRLALIIYLNDNWKSQYGGQFELWNSEGTKCEKAIVPAFNRTVIFQVEGAYHGVTNPIAHPGGMSRKSFMAYYHTGGDAGAQKLTAHSSEYAPSFYQKSSAGKRVKRVIRDITPPILTRLVRGLSSR